MKKNGAQLCLCRIITSLFLISNYLSSLLPHASDYPASLSHSIENPLPSGKRIWDLLSCFLALEKAMASHSSTLAWKIPWTEKPGRLQSMGCWGSDMTERLHFHFSLSCIGEGNGNPLQCSCLENPRDGGAWWAAVSGVTQSRTRLKWLSSSSKVNIIERVQVSFTDKLILKCKSQTSVSHIKFYM